MKKEPILALVLAAATGIAGYAITGRPGMASAPAPKTEPDPAFTPEAEQASRQLLENYGDVRAWLTLTDALIRAGRTETAVAALESAMRSIPASADLWVQMGIALVAHAGGEVLPAARLAFDRAARLSPEHPAPAYFLGLAWLQAGEIDRAQESWVALRNRSPADAPWLPMLDSRIEALNRMKLAMTGQTGIAVDSRPSPAPAGDRP